jgi:hypothetical protein
MFALRLSPYGNIAVPTLARTLKFSEVLSVAKFSSQLSIMAILPLLNASEASSHFQFALSGAETSTMRL